MDLASMRLSFKAHTSGHTDDWTDNAIDAKLNNIFAEFLPADIDGKMHEVTWVKTLSANENPVPIPNHILSFPTGMFYLQGTGGNITGSQFFISYFDDLTHFRRRYPEYLSTANVGQPTAILRQGKSLYLDVFPDAEYNLIADARGARAAALTTDGLPFNHAMAVVAGAAWNFLLEHEDEVAVSRIANIYDTYKTRLLVEYGSDWHGRSDARSF
jgi:hypothetical protein